MDYVQVVQPENCTVFNAGETRTAQIQSAFFTLSSQPSGDSAKLLSSKSGSMVVLHIGQLTNIKLCQV